MRPKKHPDFSSELLKRVRDRDEEALNTFFECYFDRTYAYVCRLVRDVHEAEDITQVAFIKMHRAIHTLETERDPTSWVFAVVSNAVRDHWRSRRYRQSLRSQTIEDIPLSAGVTAQDHQEAREAGEALARALDGLSENLKVVVLMRDFEDLGYGEIAEILGIGEPAARKRHSRALGELKAALDGHDETLERQEP